ncbi:MAG: hypothetical protein GY928_29225 [Colwellia sp.]|nr:hypothetical protein [Colwellia sp.]
MIENSVEKVNDGTRLVNESGENLSEIVDSVTKVCDIIGNIASSAREQTAGIDQVNAAVAQMDQMTQQNAALVEEATAASRSMADQAKEMNEEMQFFTIDKNKTSTNKPVKEQIVKKTVCLPPVTKAIRRPSFSTSASDEWEEF